MEWIQTREVRGGRGGKATHRSGAGSGEVSESAVTAFRMLGYTS